MYTPVIKKNGRVKFHSQRRRRLVGDDGYRFYYFNPSMPDDADMRLQIMPSFLQMIASVGSALGHCLWECSLKFHWNRDDKFHLNFHQNTQIFIQKSEMENVIWIAVICSGLNVLIQ